MSPYFVFNGNCEEALEFYKKAFHGEITILNKFGSMPPNPQYPVKEEWKELVMHARLKLENGSEIICSDSLPETPVTDGNSIKIMVLFQDAAKAKETYDILKEGAQIRLELQKTFFSPCHGELTDKFGKQWVLSTVNE